MISYDKETAWVIFIVHCIQTKPKNVKVYFIFTSIQTGAATILFPILRKPHPIITANLNSAYIVHVVCNHYFWNHTQLNPSPTGCFFIFL